MIIIIGDVCENLLTICLIYKPSSRTPRQVRCSDKSFLPGDRMKRTTVLVFIIILVSGDCRNDVTKRAIGCKELYNATSASINLTAFQQFCNKAEKCGLPRQFYNFSCRKQIIDFCVRNRSQINATTIKSECCKNVTEKDSTARKNTRSKCFKIKVEWGRVKFQTRYDLVERAWKKETWSFFLKMVSQKCLNKFIVRRRPVTILYPYYTNNKRKTVFSYKSPLAYLAVEKQSFSMFTVVYASFSRMWITLLLCVMWTLISGVIIWLLVSKYLGFLSFM